MISIVCVYNNEKILKTVLLKSLKNQTVQFELISLDNTGNRFQSASEALNYGGAKTQGDYIMFAHQDMWLSGNSWLETAENTLTTIPELGIAGVAGLSEKGRTWKERYKYSITIFDEEWRNTRPVDGFQEVQTLDECLLIIPRLVFNKLKFDEKIFDGWDCYGADYCLAVKKLGLKAYVISEGCSHCCLRAKFRPWELSGLLKYQKRLYQKYKRDYKTIYTWTGKLTWLTLSLRSVIGLVGFLYTKMFPQSSVIMKNEISGCDSVLDLGCGHFSPIYTLKVPFSVGVDLSEPYLLENKRLNIHSQYILADIRNVEFKRNSFDAVIALDVLEYLTQQEGMALLKKMEKWARKKVMIKTPNLVSIHSIEDKNLMKKYQSVWEAEVFKEIGFKIRGLDGWKKIKAENKYLRELVLTLTQKIVFYFPKQAASFLVSKRTDTK